MALWALVHDSCSRRVFGKKEEPLISKLSYGFSGGKSGNYELLQISADSTWYLQARRGQEKTIAEETEKDFWARLNDAVKLDELKQVKSHPGHALYDGIDTTLSVAVQNEIHTVVNGGEDTLNYQRIRPLISVLEKKLEGVRSKIFW
jgi:hypothetical protein